MRKNKNNRVMILWISLVSCGLLVAMLGCFLKYGLCKPLGIFQDESPITLPFVLLSKQGQRELAAELEASRAAQADETHDPDPGVTTAPEATSEPTTVPTTTPPTTQTEPPTTTEPPAPRFPQPVYGEDESYFDDVVFIGDSRTCGLRDYNRLGKADYFCNVGMNVFSVWGETASDQSFSNLTLSELLSSKQYGKVYIALGINECGYPLENLEDAFKELIAGVREIQPDAVIVLNSIMTVGREKAASASYFSLENIGAVNSMIASLANVEDDIFYLDVNQVFADEEGYLSDEMSSDGCHLYGIYYETWARWLCGSVAQLNDACSSLMNG